ncbi:reverse transcriptase domain-containing protein [Tanacetum coccineum]
MTPPSGFSTPPQIPNNTTSERPPVTTTVFIATTPENTIFAYHASTSANPNPMIIPAFVEENYEILESLLREQRRQICNEDLRPELEYFSEDYDEEREMEPKPEPHREATPTIRPRSPIVRLSSSGRTKNALPYWFLRWKRDPDNFLHLFEGAILMHKWLMPIACHMFTYTLKDYARICCNSQKIGRILNYEDLKAKFRSHFSQQKKFTKTHLAVHNIKKREGKSSRAFITKYTNDTLQVLGLHEEQRISRFVHGLRTRSLVEHLSTDLPSTYKGLMEKTYTWIEAREVATNGTPNNPRENFKRSKRSSWDNKRRQKGRDRFSPYRGPNHGLLSNLSKIPREMLATEKAAKSFEQPPCKFGSRRSRDMSKYCHFQEDHGHDTNDCCQLRNQIEEAVKSEQLSHLVKGIKKERDESASKIDSKVPLVGFSGEKSWSIGKIPLEITIGKTTMQRMGIVVSTIHGAIKFHTAEGIEEKVIINNKYPKQTVTIEKQLPEHFKRRLRDLLKANADVFAWTHVDMTGIPRTIMVKGKPFNTEQKLNEYSHVKPIKQKRRGLGPDRSIAACKEVEELMKAGIL